MNNQFKLINKGVSTPIGILIIVIFALLAGGVTAWQYFETQKEIIKAPEEIDETANWKTYRNEEYGFEFKYPKEWSYRREMSPSGPFTTTIFSRDGQETMRIYNPFPEIGFEAWDIGRGEKLLVPGGDKYIAKRILTPSKQCDEIMCPAAISNPVNAVQVYWPPGVLLPSPTQEEWLKSGLVHFNYKNEKELKLFNQILSTFQFLK